MDRVYINYEKFETLAERNVVYVTKLKKNIPYEVLKEYMYMTEDGNMKYGEQAVVFRKGEISHITKIITYADIKKANSQSSYICSLMILNDSG